MNSAQDPVQFSAFVTPSEEHKWQSVIITPTASYLEYPYKGRLYGVLSLSNPQKRVDCVSIGELLQDALFDAFYETNEDSIIDLLEETIRKTKERLLEIMSQSKVIGNEVVDMELTLVSVRDNVFYIASFGNTDIELYNKNKKINLRDFLKDTSGRNGVEVMSGILKKDDRILFSISNSLTRIIDAKLRDHIFNFDLTDLIPHLREGLHSCVLLLGYEVFAPTITKKEEVVPHFEEVQEENISFNESVEHENVEENSHMKEQLEEIPEIAKETEEFVEEKPRASVRRQEFNQSLESNTEVDQKDEVFNSVPLTDEEKYVEEVSSKPKVDPKVILSKISLVLGNIKSKIFNKENQSTFMYLIQKLLSGIKNLFMKLFLLIKSLFSRSARRRVNPIFLKSSRSSKTKLIVIGVAILALLLALFFGVRQISANNEEKKKVESANALVEEAKTLSTQAQTNALLNKDKARSLITESNTKADAALKVSSTVSEAIKGVKATNEATLLDIDKIVQLNDSTIFSDIYLKFPSFKPQSLSLSSDRIYIAEKTGTVLESLKSNMDFTKLPIEDGKLSSISATTVDGTNLVIMDPKEGLFSYSSKTKALSKLTGLSDVVVGQVSSMVATTVAKQSYIYTLRSDTGAVTRLPKLSESYAQPETRFTDDRLVEGLDIEVDGKVWAVTKENIYRFVNNKEEGFSLDKAGLPKPISSFSKIAISSKYLFIADNTNKRVVIVTKGASNNASKIDYVASLSYKGVLGEFNDIIDMKLDNDVLYILDSKRVYKFDTNNIPEKYKPV
jgi:hypothetical protein